MAELTEAEFPRTWASMRAAVAEGVTPGVVAGLWRAQEPDRALVGAHGKRRTTPSPQPLDAETPFDLSSVTKIMGTAALTALLVDRGWLKWTTPLAAIFAGYPHREIELRHLLSHTAGFTAWQPWYEKMREAFGGTAQSLACAPITARQEKMREMILGIAPEARPGERALYSDVSFLLLGFALEEVLGGMPLDRAVETLVWRPWGIDGAFYRRVTRGVEAGRLERAAATEDCPWRGGVLQGQVHDDNCWAMGGYSGHAGAFGRAEDVLRFARKLFERALVPETLKALWTPVARPPGCARTLGWDTPSATDSLVGSLFSRRGVGHWGFTGTSLWVDPHAGLAVTLLTNRVHPSRENMKIREFRPKFHDALVQDLAALGPPMR